MENKRCWNGYAERKIEKNLVPYYSGMAFVSRFVFWPDRRSLIDRVIWVTMAEYNGWCNCRIPSEFLLRHLLFFSSYVSIWCWYCSLPWRKIELNSPMPVNADFRFFFSVCEFSVKTISWCFHLSSDTVERPGKQGKHGNGMCRLMLRSLTEAIKIMPWYLV